MRLLMVLVGAFPEILEPTNTPLYVFFRRAFLLFKEKFLVGEKVSNCVIGDHIRIELPKFLEPFSIVVINNARNQQIIGVVNEVFLQ